MVKKEKTNTHTGQRVLIITLVIIIIFLVFFLLKPYKHIFNAGHPLSLSQAPTLSSTNSDCTPNDLQASIDLSPGAGNVFGTFTLKNISSNTCRVLGGLFITVHYNNTIQNITVSNMGQTPLQPFILPPNQTIYSQVHYPNGPQCSTGVVSTKVIFTYKISPTHIVIFKDMNGMAQQTVQTCSLATDNTEIQIWNMSNTPIIP